MTTMIAVSIGDIRRAHPLALREVASRLSSHAAILRDISTAATRFAPSTDDWSGPASGSAGGRHTEIAVAAHTLGEGLQRCAQAIHAAADQASRSTTLTSGLPIVSPNTSLVLSSTCWASSSGFSGSTKRTSMPNCGRVCANSA